VEAGHGVVYPHSFQTRGRKRLLYPPTHRTTEVASVGIARATKGDVTLAGENFAKSCEISNGAIAAKSKPTKPAHAT